MSSIDDYLQYLHYQPDECRQHIAIADSALCRDCSNRRCLSLCPAGVFFPGDNQEEPVRTFYKQCVECGACRLICNNINFFYPTEGRGVRFEEG